MAYRLLIGVMAMVFGVAAADAQTVFVSNEKDDTVSVIDVKTLEVVDTFEVGQRPRGITLSKDFSKLYVCASDDDRVEIYDTESYKKIGDFPIGAKIRRILH